MSKLVPDIGSATKHEHKTISIRLLTHDYSYHQWMVTLQKPMILELKLCTFDVDKAPCKQLVNNNENGVCSILTRADRRSRTSYRPTGRHLAWSTCYVLPSVAVLNKSVVNEMEVLRSKRLSKQTAVNSTTANDNNTMKNANKCVSAALYHYNNGGGLYSVVYCRDGRN